MCIIDRSCIVCRNAESRSSWYGGSRRFIYGYFHHRHPERKACARGTPARCRSIGLCMYAERCHAYTARCFERADEITIHLPSIHSAGRVSSAGWLCLVSVRTACWYRQFSRLCRSIQLDVSYRLHITYWSIWLFSCNAFDFLKIIPNSRIEWLGKRAERHVKVKRIPLHDVNISRSR